jgi:hypothetical protein
LREGCGGRPQGGAQRSGARERSAPRSSPTPRGKAARPARGGTPKSVNQLSFGTLPYSVGMEKGFIGYLTEKYF